MQKTIKAETLNLVDSFTLAAKQMAESNPELLNDVAQVMVSTAHQELRVMCDEPNCDWESEDFGQLPDKHDQLYSWHNEPCPCCDSGMVVSTEDLGNYVISNFFLSKMQQESNPEVIEEARRNGLSQELEISSRAGGLKFR